jgi:hypothetical protein
MTPDTPPAFGRERHRPCGVTRVSRERLSLTREGLAVENTRFHAQ